MPGWGKLTGRTKVGDAVMLAREDSGTYRLTIDGRTVGRVERPLERPMLGRDKGTVYLARAPRLRRRPSSDRPA